MNVAVTTIYLQLSVS